MKGGRNIGEVGKGKGRLKGERSVRGEVQRIVKGRLDSWVESFLIIWSTCNDKDPVESSLYIYTGVYLELPM